MLNRWIIVFFSFAVTSGFAQTFEEFMKTGDEFYAVRNYKDAIYNFTQAIGLQPNNSKGYWYRGDCYREMNDYQNAATDYSIAVDLEPKNARLRRLRGDSYYDMKNYAMAEKDYTKSIDLDPNSATTWLYRGDCYELTQQKDKACSDYKKAQELGSKHAKPRAVKLGCEWTKFMAGAKPCPTGEAAITKVETDPLNGAVFIGKGISYDGFEIITDDGAHLSGPEFASDEVFDIILKNVKGFCSDTDGVIHMGAGYSVRENGGREVETVHNIYPVDQVLKGEAAKNIKVQFKVPAGLTMHKQHILTAHFYDTRGNAEVFTELPFIVTPKTLTSLAPISRTNQNGLRTAGDGGAISGIALHHKHHGGLISFDQLERNQEYIVTASDVKSFNKRSHFIFRFLDPVGNIALEHKGRSVYHGEHIKLDFKTINLAPGNYTLWLKIQELDAPLNVGIVVPVTVK